MYACTLDLTAGGIRTHDVAAFASNDIVSISFCTGQ